MGKKKVLILVLPGLLLILLIAIYPFASAVYLSFTDAQLTRSTTKFIGVSNYASVLKSHDFWVYLRNTGTYSLGCSLIEVLLGFGIALLLNVEGIKGKRVFRSIVLLPLMIPPVVGSLMWSIILEPERGPLNYVLSLLGFNRISWLADPRFALPTVMGVDIYIFTPFAILVILAALQGIPLEVVEAAKVDGATGFQILRFVTYPMIKQTLFLTFLIRLALALTSFEIIYVLTKGGPGIATMTLNIQAYTSFYRYFYSSVAAVYGVILWAIIFIVTNLLINRTRRAWEE